VDLPEDVLSVGVDMGSRSTKVCVKSQNGQTLSMFDSYRFISHPGNLDIGKGLPVVSTGYGRDRIQHARKVPEIRAHTVGAVYTLGLGDFTLLDIGGQDFKVTRVENGAIRDFHMNDKCAAGTGRFLEMMASVLDMSVDELGRFEGSGVPLESTCSVFTESEVVGMMMEGKGKEEICGGIIQSVYERVRPYLRRYPLDLVIFTGGVSKAEGLRFTIQRELDVEVKVPKSSQFMGALGCAEIAKRTLE